MTRAGLHAEFIGSSGRRLFVLLRTPEASQGACTLVVPAFAEEMNKSRRLVADYARASCSNGKAVLCVDVSGTGDSDGEFSSARLAQWIEDLTSAAAWSEARGWRVDSLLGIRLGALLAARLACRSGLSLSTAVFWQPVTSGTRFMDQFLRVRAVASRLEGGTPETVAGMRQRLAAGESLEVAGYELSGTLCADIDALELDREVAPAFPRTRWIEVVSAESSGPGPGARRMIDKLSESGVEVEFIQVAGEPFWTSTETVLNPALVAAS